MRKIIFACVSILSIGFLNAQSFDKGSRNLDINLGFGIYNTSIKENSTTLNPNPADTTVTGKTACTILAPAMEWGVGKRSSIGTSLVYSHYLTSTDSVTGKKPKASGLDGNFLFNFHFVKSKKADLFCGLKLGIAGFRLNPQDGGIYGSMGSAFDLHFGGRFYVSERIGIIANLSFPSYTFRKFGDSLDYTYTLKFRGFSIGTGVAIKLKGKTEAASSTSGGK